MVPVGSMYVANYRAIDPYIKKLLTVDHLYGVNSTNHSLAVMSNFARVIGIEGPRNFVP